MTRSTVVFHLTRRAENRSPLGNPQARQSVPATGAFETITTVNLVGGLISARLAICVPIIFDRRSAVVDRVSQNSTDLARERPHRFSIEIARQNLRMYARCKQSLVGVDIANASNDGLIKKRGLDRPRRARKTVRKHRPANSQRVWSQIGPGLLCAAGRSADDPEPSWIDKRDAQAVVERPDDMRVRRRIVDAAHGARHAELYDDGGRARLIPGARLDRHLLAAAGESGDGHVFEKPRFFYSDRGRRASAPRKPAGRVTRCDDHIAPSNIDARDCAPNQARFQRSAECFDFGQFGHA